MSTTQAVREHFQSHPGVEFDNAQLREALDIDDGQAISVALNQMFNNGEIRREKKDGMGCVYWLPGRGAPTRATLSPAAAAEKILAARSAAAPDSAPKAGKGKRGGKRAGKRAYVRRAPAEALPADILAPGDPGGVLFAIRNDGELGIDNAGNQVSLCRAEVRRLQAFLDTVAPLWKGNQAAG